MGRRSGRLPASDLKDPLETAARPSQSQPAPAGLRPAEVDSVHPPVFSPVYAPASNRMVGLDALQCRVGVEYAVTRTLSLDKQGKQQKKTTLRKERS